MHVDKLQPLMAHQHRVRLGEPLPFGICDADGRLLLARGHVIRTQEQLESLVDRGSFVRQADLQDMASSIAAAKPTELPAMWHSGIDRVARLLVRTGATAQEFADALESAAGPTLALVARDPDLAIFQVVRRDDADVPQYASRQALHCAVAAHLAAERLQWDKDAIRSVVRAALTSNIAMAELQAALALQLTPPITLQREAIRCHPERSAQLLEAVGVTDTRWLDAVRTHHEASDGTGYPNGILQRNEIALLLRRADVFVAKLSQRATRQAIAADVAARQFFQAHPGDPMTAAMIKEFGLYPPGCAVRLKSGETGVVMRRGEGANRPVVVVLTDRNGDALLAPVRRDTAQDRHAVVAVVPSRTLKVRVTQETLVKIAMD